MFVKGFVFMLATLTTLTNAKRVCYEKYGCFSHLSPSTRRFFVKLPQSPSNIGTKFHLFTRSNTKSSQIIDDDDRNKLTASNFRISRRTIFVIHGFTENINTWNKPMKDALLARENCNVILVDWSRGARSPYGQAAGNTRLVGVQIAELIRFLISSNSGSSSLANRFYIVGFSLGAHTAGYAGSSLRARGMVLGRITGLDPAGPYFTKNIKPDVRLDPSDALYVDVIHTDAGKLGTTTKGGHIDFFPNGGSRQPGCVFNLFKPVGSISCNHMRAPAYYTASVKRLCSWTAYPCSSYRNFQRGKCLRCNGSCPSMGYDADRTKRSGTFYLTTNCSI